MENGNLANGSVMRMWMACPLQAWRQQPWLAGGFGYGGCWRGRNGVRRVTEQRKLPSLGGEGTTGLSVLVAVARHGLFHSTTFPF